MICKIAYNIKYMIINTIILKELIDKYYSPKNSLNGGIDT